MDTANETIVFLILFARVWSELKLGFFSTYKKKLATNQDFSCKISCITLRITDKV